MEIDLSRSDYYVVVFLVVWKLFYRNCHYYLHCTYLIGVIEHQHCPDQNEQDRPYQSNPNLGCLLCLNLFPERHHRCVSNRRSLLEKCGNHCFSIMGTFAAFESAEKEVWSDRERKDYEKIQLIIGNMIFYVFYVLLLINTIFFYALGFILLIIISQHEVLCSINIQTQLTIKKSLITFKQNTKILPFLQFHWASSLL